MYIENTRVRPTTTTYEGESKKNKKKIKKIFHQSW